MRTQLHTRTPHSDASPLMAAHIMPWTAAAAQEELGPKKMATPHPNPHPTPTPRRTSVPKKTAKPNPKRIHNLTPRRTSAPRKMVAVSTTKRSTRVSTTEMSKPPTTMKTWS